MKHVYSVKNSLIDCVTLTFDVSTETIPLLGYLKIIPCTQFEDFVVTRFLIMPQTNKQTDGAQYPTHTD